MDVDRPVRRLEHLSPNSSVLVAKRAPLDEEREKGIELILRQVRG